MLFKKMFIEIVITATNESFKLARVSWLYLPVSLLAFQTLLALYYEY